MWHVHQYPTKRMHSVLKAIKSHQFCWSYAIALGIRISELINFVRWYGQNTYGHTANYHRDFDGKTVPLANIPHAFIFNAFRRNCVIERKQIAEQPRAI
jgi:hypothetical protein